MGCNTVELWAEWWPSKCKVLSQCTGSFRWHITKLEKIKGVDIEISSTHFKPLQTSSLRWPLLQSGMVFFFLFILNAGLCFAHQFHKTFIHSFLCTQLCMWRSENNLEGDNFLLWVPSTVLLSSDLVTRALTWYTIYTLTHKLTYTHVIGFFLNANSWFALYNSWPWLLTKLSWKLNLTLFLWLMQSVCMWWFGERRSQLRSKSIKMLSLQRLVL